KEKPYHVIHFDGHGAYDDRGYLVFENPEFEENHEFVDGTSLGQLLVETGTPVLVLNACRSAYAEPSTAPAVSDGENPHAEVRTYGSLAQEVMDTGVAGVVANRYNIYVDTAAQFIGELYARLAAGDSLGEAVGLGRKQLSAQPLRTIAYDPRPLEDWSVPLVYEAAPVALFPKSEERAKLTIKLGEAETPGRGDLDPK
ncbi:MAG: CHAT domain-containing protein, partial [bacterium]|nr:CHAT domain-containing protein [bacterium]